MKDEEMAGEWVMNNSKDIINKVSNGETNLFGVAEQAFLAGLKVGRPQWHDLRENPNDLPPMIQDERHISDRVWINVENWGTEDGYYDYKKNCWIIRCRIVNLPILGWCEIPTFDKE